MPYDKKSFILGLAAGLATRGVSGKGQESPPQEAYLTFSSPNPFTLSVYNSTKNWDGTLEWSTDIITWEEWDGTTALSSTLFDGNYKLFLRGTNNQKIAGSRKYWVINGALVECNGDIRTLLNYKSPTSTTMGTDCFSSMFFNCTALTKAPELPSTELSDWCYAAMFSGCTSLVSAPTLPASVLAYHCYDHMLYNCASLTKAPALSASVMAQGCCRYMFSRCTSLIKPPKLSALSLAAACYEEMFNQCTSLTTLPHLPATNLAPSCYFLMFNGCTKVKISETQTGTYQTPYRIPTSGVGVTSTNALYGVFTNTGGTFTGTPDINTAYYTANEVV